MFTKFLAPGRVGRPGSVPVSGAVFLPADQPLRPAGQPEIGQQIGGSLYQRINHFFPSRSPAPLLQRITHSFTPADQPTFPQRIIRSPTPADQPLLPQRIIRSPTPADQPLLPQRIIRLHAPADKPLFPACPTPADQPLILRPSDTVLPSTAAIFRLQAFLLPEPRGREEPRTRCHAEVLLQRPRDRH